MDRVERIPQLKELQVKSLGECMIDSPMKQNGFRRFISDADRWLFEANVQKLMKMGRGLDKVPSFELAGPRERIFFDPAKLHVGVVTCGGVCPGLNNVIRSVVWSLYYNYGVRMVSGFQYGQQGFVSKYGHAMVRLTPGEVDTLQERGGTCLGTSRGRQDEGEIVRCLRNENVHALVVVGGDGSLRGALDISKEAKRQGYQLAVIGIPKTIDNDIMYTDSFGFVTAYTRMVKDEMESAHNEANSVPRCVIIVKTMGRYSGFLTAETVRACNYANYCFVPEVPFCLEGEGGLLADIADKLEFHPGETRRAHAVIVVAEGAGQDLIRKDLDYYEELTGRREPGNGQIQDASGNVQLYDVGRYLEGKIKDYFQGEKRETNVKLLDPGFAPRSGQACASDSIYCLELGHLAVHALMAGKTDMLVGRWNDALVHVPIKAAVKQHKKLDPNGDIWQLVLEATGQPSWD